MYVLNTGGLPVAAIEREMGTTEGMTSTLTAATTNILELDKYSTLGCTEFSMPYNTVGGNVKWKIRASNEIVNMCSFEPEPLQIDIDLKESLLYNFFELVFPLVRGHSNIIDKYLFVPRAAYYKTVEIDHFKFNDPNVDDHDHIIK